MTPGDALSRHVITCHLTSRARYIQTILLTITLITILAWHWRITPAPPPSLPLDRPRRLPWTPVAAFPLQVSLLRRKKKGTLDQDHFRARFCLPCVDSRLQSTSQASHILPQLTFDVTYTQILQLVYNPTIAISYATHAFTSGSLLSRCSGRSSLQSASCSVQCSVCASALVPFGQVPKPCYIHTWEVDS